MYVIYVCDVQMYEYDIPLEGWGWGMNVRGSRLGKSSYAARTTYLPVPMLFGVSWWASGGAESIGLAFLPVLTRDIIRFVKHSLFT